MATTGDDPVSFNNVKWDLEADREARDDADLMNSLLNGDSTTGINIDLERPLEVGEKADDAQDFEDISDDDLPDEEEAAHGHGDLPGLTDDAGTSNDTDDLFGEGRDSSPFGDDLFGPDHHDDLAVPSQDQLDDLAALNFPEHYGYANQDPNIPAPAESEEDLVKQFWPTFKQGVNLVFSELLPIKPAHHIPKVPLKAPKPMNPTKVSLDLAQDQEKAFRSAGTATSTKRKRSSEAEAKGLVPVIEESEAEVSDDDDFDWTPASQLEPIGGLTFADLDIVCADWDSKVNASPVAHAVLQEEPLDDWEAQILGHSSKRRRIEEKEVSVFNASRFETPSFDNFEEDTKRIAKRVRLDLNDPHLLLDIREADLKRQRLGPDGSFKVIRKGGLSTSLSKRFNVSNDEAYDALKENHQSKVRATIGNLSVEHSMPALKLQWPYYRVKLTAKDARSFHRPALKFNRFVGQNIHFSRPGLRKRKTFKSLAVQDVFAESKDLSLMDHYASATLLEYSEEHPTVLSNFGMGNRIINYYRRKTHDDPERPQPDDKVGDTTVLLPEDKSPFSNFGRVDPGETVRTIHNAMYRAPIFKHEAKNTDFLVVRSSTGVGGTSWHMRNIDNLFVVGQQFPSMEIPGPHSRKVTNAAKNRMKMIAYRKIRHSPHQHLRIQEVTQHISESSDMQNRQKLKEFITYDKTEKVWKMNPNEAVPDEPTIRSMVKPEEVCVIDAMQVGARHLEDAGYAVDEDDEAPEAVETGTGKDGKKKVGEETTNLEQNLAPWKTSKAFLDASADKAMLQLHGAGDPSGHGLAFSFIKTSMKGGYLNALQGPSASSTTAMAARKATDRKANGGHDYNVKEQQKVYTRSIHEIWDGQKSNLTDPTEHVENEMEIDEEEEDRIRDGDETPRSHRGGNFDDSVSQISTGSRPGRGQVRTMRITRHVTNAYGEVIPTIDIIEDPKVIREYQRRRALLDAESMDVYTAKPTGNAELDAAQTHALKLERARLEKNRERRMAREAQKKKQQGRQSSFVPKEEDAGSPSATPAPTIEKAAGTTRKCANCGEVGHIKTNKKLCPMLNGTRKMDDAPDHGGFGAITAPSFS
ncbi:transcription initiation factor [Hyphodiscus hymeniophilus]|uniref:Transcription initiation factor n=1 Tax=Hyphodiscus hymeniophilus TaxID=353542 RepID=A0A9P6VR88_9HELO|nr:transcription initiation factor [Hyphodiscus hymeniophilus]